MRPVYRTPEAGAPSIFPILFVTIACGAISGFHGLVSSGTTSKQIDRLPDSRVIGYGAMLGEGSLALASTLAAVAGIGLVGACALPGQGVVDDLSWAVYYDSWAHAGGNKAAAFVLGGGAFLEAVGLSPELARTLMAVLVIAFAATSLDTATRIQRFILGELGEALRIKPLTNPYIATVIAVVPAMYLALAETPDPTTGQAKAVGWVLWPIFGASNQLLAALTLMTLSLYFFARKRPVWPLVIPMLLVMPVAGLALITKLQQFLAEGNAPLAALASLLLVLLLWMIVEGLMAVQRLRQRLALLDPLVEPQQRDRACDRDRKAPDVEARDVTKTEPGSDEAADQCASDTEGSSLYEPTAVVTWHDELGENARKQSKHDPRDDSHRSPPAERVLSKIRVSASASVSASVSVSASAGVSVSASAGVSEA